MNVYRKEVKGSEKGTNATVIVAAESGAELFRSNYSKNSEAAANASDKAIASWFRFHPEAIEDEYLTFINS